ncbi:MAG: acetylglutamate kinase [Sumerlaeia bacterium]
MEDITTLRQALPYIQKFKGRVFVVKIGGEAIRNTTALERLVGDVALLHNVGIRLVLVHGANPQINSLSQRLNLEIKKVGGRRITDGETLEVLKMALAGQVNTDIVSQFRRHNVKAVGLTGLSADLLQATRRPPRKVDGADGPIDFGFVGDIQQVDVGLLRSLLDQDYLPVIAPLGADKNGQALNINADVAASHIAITLKADKLLLMTGPLGVMTDPADENSLIATLTARETREAIDNGIITEGMIPKVQEALNALGHGVPQAHIISAIEPHQLLLEVFTNTGCGTMFVP